MHKSIPRTPFSTRLSGSAKEAERRVRNIFLPKKRPPVLFLALVFSLCLLSGNLVSCHMAAQPEPEPETTGLTRYELAGESQTSLTVGERWEFTLRQEPYDEATGAAATRLLCLDRTTGEETELNVDYNRETYGLRPFSGFLGREGVVLVRPCIPYSIPNTPEWLFIQIGEDGPSHLLTCAGDIYAGKAAGRDVAVSVARPDLLYPALYAAWLEEDGQVRTLPLRDAVEDCLGLGDADTYNLLYDLDADPAALTLSKLQPLGELEPFETLPWDQMMDFLWNQSNRTRTIPLGQWKGAELALELTERHSERWIPYVVDRVDVCLDGQVIQTIQVPEVMPGSTDIPWQDWSLDCFYDYAHAYAEGAPKVMDLNFDGHLDFGLTPDEGFARNISYIFYLWNPEREQFDCFHSFYSTLGTDPDTQQLTETDYGGNWGDTLRVYGWEDGQLVLLRREEEDWANSPEEGVMTEEGWRHQQLVHIYVRENGQLVQKEDEIRYYIGG